jgi:hypothetical protein
MERKGIGFMNASASFKPDHKLTSDLRGIAKAVIKGMRFFVNDSKDLKYSLLKYELHRVKRKLEPLALRRHMPFSQLKER